MPSITKSFRLLSDPTRLRILLLVAEEELSVAELQEILSMGQSRISTQLSQMKAAGLLRDRRSGKHVLYRVPRKVDAETSEIQNTLLGLARHAATELPEAEQDQAALQLILQKRSDKARAYFDELAGQFGSSYLPGRSWKGLGETLLKLMPPLVIADLGAGEGTFSQLLAQRAKQVIAIDNSEKMVEYGTEVATKNGFQNLEYRLGDLEAPPIEDSSVDVAFFSQALHHAQSPERAVAEAFRIVRPGGRIVVLDLLKHNFEQARDLYADRWLGFAEVEVYGFLESAGFEDIEIDIVHREEKKPKLETLLAIGNKQ